MAAGKASIPVYLPNQTVIGKATINDNMLSIEMHNVELIKELITGEMVGVSFVYMNNDARDLVEKEFCNEKTCLYHMPHFHGDACFVNCDICTKN